MLMAVLLWELTGFVPKLPLFWWAHSPLRRPSGFLPSQE